MKTSFSYNGSARVLMTPENPIEEAILREMAERSEKGSTTVFAAPGRNEKEFVLEVGGQR